MPAFLKERRRHQQDKRECKLERKEKASSNWPHHPDRLLKKEAIYSVKYLGSVNVPKDSGEDIAKEAIQKLMFSAESRKADGGKVQKMYMAISIENICLREQKYKFEHEVFPLARISFCADDKSNKKLVAFIVRGRTNESGHDVDMGLFFCHVVESDKYADEITLTIGQAFDLSYRKFLSSSSKEMEVQSKISQMRLAVNERDKQIHDLKRQVEVLENLLAKNGIAIPTSKFNNEKENFQQIQRPYSKTNVNIPALNPPPLFKSKNRHSESDINNLLVIDDQSNAIEDDPFNIYSSTSNEVLGKHYSQDLDLSILDPLG